MTSVNSTGGSNTVDMQQVDSATPVDGSDATKDANKKLDDLKALIKNMEDLVKLLTVLEDVAESGKDDAKKAHKSNINAAKNTAAEGAKGLKGVGVDLENLFGMMLNAFSQANSGTPSADPAA